jgi:hypothetical protein
VLVRLARAALVAMVVVGGLLAAPARAVGEPRDVVALLPLAAEKRLALYGQPVASELARALRAGGLDVVVVSAGAPVPSRARLVVDGHIAMAGDAVVIDARVRDPARGMVVATVSARAAALTAIDRAAADLASQLLPAVTEQLAALAEPGRAEPPVASPATAPTASPTTAASIDRRPVAHVAVVHRVPFEPARAVGEAIARRAGYRPAAVSSGAALELHVEILAFAIEDLGVPVGRARARVRAVAGGVTRFDRVVRTDSIVGARRSTPEALARQAAAQIVDIVSPRLREQLAVAP